jgi:hypothetical protein
MWYVQYDTGDSKHYALRDFSTAFKIQPKNPTISCSANSIISKMTSIDTSVNRKSLSIDRVLTSQSAGGVRIIES